MHFETILNQFCEAKILDFLSFSLFFSMSDFDRNLAVKKLENQADMARGNFGRNMVRGFLGEDLGEG